MRCARVALLISQLVLTGAWGAQPASDSVCPEQPTEPLRQRPGRDAPERLEPVECDPTRLPTPPAAPLPGPVPVDRWRMIDSLGHPANTLDPYNTNNVLKGDRPVRGADGFSVLTVSGTSLLESRRVPARPDSATGRLDTTQQFFSSQTVSLDGVLYKGDTVFRPPDYLLRVTPILNYSSTRSDGSQTSTRSVGAQALFVEKHLRDVSDRYDFDSIRLGIQPVTSDFRGFVIADQPVGVRLFGTRDNNIYQYSVGWFRRLPKNPARQNDLGAGVPHNDLLLANLYIQDLGRLGLTSEFVLILDHSRVPGTRVTPGATTAFATGVRHDYDVAYLGYAADGHLGRTNLSLAVYEILGHEAQALFTGRSSTVQASFAAVELSRDFDWIRLRASGLYASGDGDPSDARSQGFDGINQSALFAGSDSAFFIHQRLSLVPGALDLKQRDSLFASMRSTLDSGESNFTNPGIGLLGLGADLDLAPSLRLSFDANRLRFSRTAPLQAALGSQEIAADIGTDVSVDAIYRPLISQNVIARLSLAKLFNASRTRGVVGTEAPFSAFFSLVLTY